MDIMPENEEGDLNNIPTRLMRIKILYTFDADNKTTCLARFPDARAIPAVAIDDQSQVGIIDLQTCIQAVVAASPEILSKMDDGDFAVYAYDYSETDTPLLGQGRLSTLLDATSPPGAAASKITGRVCQNVPMLFSNGVKETLEVRLRLTPVRKPTPHEVSRTAGSNRSISPATSTGFDPNAWDTSIHQNKTPQSLGGYFDFSTMSSADASAFDDIFSMDPEQSGESGDSQPDQRAGVAETPTNPTFGQNPAFPAQSYSAPGSRAASPMMGSDSNPRNDMIRHTSFSGQTNANAIDQSRPESRDSTRSEANAQRHRPHLSTQPRREQPAQPQTETFYDDDGRPYKRAKVVPADWRGRSNFGNRSSDLRINAATASSMHMHRPIPRRATAPGSNLEPPPRVPTPVPQRTGPPRPRLPMTQSSRSMLREASTLESDDLSDVDRMSEAIFSSPEGNSPDDSIIGGITPMDIPSSPPVFADPSQIEPSSPGLPALPPSRFADSGYMSERGFDSTGAMMTTEDCGEYSPDAEQMDPAQQHLPRSRFPRQGQFIKREESFNDDARSYLREQSTFHIEEPGDMGKLPSKMLLDLPPNRSRDGSESRKSRPQPPQDGHISRRSSIALPSYSGNEASYGARPNYRRSTTGYDSEAGSPAPSDIDGRPKGMARSGSHAPRRKLIEKRLQDSLARGEMPQFCDHCGAIETPTWRKLYIKIVDGKPGPLDYVEGEGETIGIEELERDPDTGVCTKFKIRKSMKKMKDMQPGKDFKDVFVCNPCGLWFTKFKKMRPADKWHRKPNTRRKKPKDDDLMSTDAMEPPSEMFPMDPLMQEQLENDVSGSQDVFRAAQNNAQEYMAHHRPRASSMEATRTRRSSGNESGDSSFDTRTTRSSPVRFQGSQHSPIELDSTPRPTRRLLFPSPRQKGEIKSLEFSSTAITAAAVDESGTIVAQAKTKTPPQATYTVLKAVTVDKENMAPLDDTFDELSNLFDGSPGNFFKTPLPKTPSKTPRTQGHGTINLPKTPTPKSSKRKTLHDTHGNSHLATTGDGATLVATPPSARYFLRSTPSRLDRTPGGRSRSSPSDALALPGTAAGSGEPSPFSRHLAQMLSDSNGAAGEPMPFTSPGHAYDFSDLPTFATPGREVDWKGIDEMLSSEFANFEDAGS